MKYIKKFLSLILSASMLFALLPGCGINNKTVSVKEQVTIAFWSDQLTEHYGKFLQDKFPDVDFTFYAATNSTDFFRFKMEQNDLPDILTVRRFALRDVEGWRNSLMDLSDTELAGTFNQSYLRSYTYDDGTVNWLPTCAEVDSIIVNKTLLEANGISVPQNYNEFISTCNKLQEKGIRPFLSNFSADFTCMEILQGLSASALTSQAGREWRQQYESGQTNRLSEEVWLPIFQHMKEFIDSMNITEADLDIEHYDLLNDYSKGRIAMIRGTGDETERYSSENQESLLMPYYGETENDNWYLTYPAFQIAASAKANESPERKKLILDIMTAMLSEEGLRNISANQNMVSYNNNVTIDLTPSMSAIKPYIDNNHLYIRLASADMFSVSKQVVQGMIIGDYPDARSAFNAFNAALDAKRQDVQAAAHIDTAYSYAFDPNGGSRAASAIMNSVRETLGTQLLIAPAVYVAGNIAAGDYTEEELKFLTMGEGNNIIICQMTGEQIWQYMNYVLTTPGKRGSVINDSTLYVSSGFEMTVQKKENGYVLEKLTINGSELNQKTVYSAAVIGNLTLMLEDAFDAAGIKEYTKSEMDYKQIIVDRLLSGRQLAQPSEYIILKN